MGFTDKCYGGNIFTVKCHKARNFDDIQLIYKRLQLSVIMLCTD